MKTYVNERIFSAFVIPKREQTPKNQIVKDGNDQKCFSNRRRTSTIYTGKLI